ncbi:Restriction endonuclease S subunits [uncultured Eubacteriales bacterium]|uniref:Restriction endonuclease S subunits n=1 Tax=uncultured Eubacteriales bacterium TaxID=172733 RepID=A0A212K2W6_9FIRM|nr:Restriction endonuclease S subunits [uncultured Eubacteriales bacterium]
MRHKFGDIAVNSTAKKKPTPADKDIYLGLEHLDSGNLTVTRFGSEIAPIGEKILMKKGDVLFGKRRAYQKKVAIAPFDGIFSAHGMVLRPKTGVVTERFFPLFIASDYFLDAAIKISVGSLSPTINWSALKELEFNLPPLDEQDSLAEVLWAMIETRNAYKRLISLTDDLVKSQFVEMFGDPVMNNKGWDVKRLDQIAGTRLGKMLDAKQQTGKNRFPYLANFNVQWFKFDLEKLNVMDFDEVDRGEFALKYGDLLVCEGGEVGRTAIWKNEIEDCFFQKAIHRVRCHQGACIPEYLAWVMYQKATMTNFDGLVSSATIAHLTGEKLKGLLVQVPPLSLQTRFADFVRQADKSKFVAWEATKAAIQSATMMMTPLFGALEHWKTQYEQEERHDV